MAVVVGCFVTYCVMREARESVLGDRSTPFSPCKAESSCTRRDESSSFSSSSTLGGHGTRLIDLMSSLSRSATLRTSCSLQTLMGESAANHFQMCHRPFRFGLSEGGIGNQSGLKLTGQDGFDVG